MTYNLYFEKSNGEQILIKSNTSPKDNIGTKIVDAVRKMNPNFTINYIRQWMEYDGTIVYDVGGWSEFFKLVPVNQEAKEK